MSSLSDQQENPNPLCEIVVENPKSFPFTSALPFAVSIAVKSERACRV